MLAQPTKPRLVASSTISKPKQAACPRQASKRIMDGDIGPYGETPAWNCWGFCRSLPRDICRSAVSLRALDRWPCP